MKTQKLQLDILKHYLQMEDDFTEISHVCNTVAADSVCFGLNCDNCPLESVVIMKHTINTLLLENL